MEFSNFDWDLGVHGSYNFYQLPFLLLIDMNIVIERSYYRYFNLYYYYNFQFDWNKDDLIWIIYNTFFRILYPV